MVCLGVSAASTLQELIGVLPEQYSANFVGELVIFMSPRFVGMWNALVSLLFDRKTSFSIMSFIFGRARSPVERFVAPIGMLAAKYSPPPSHSPELMQPVLYERCPKPVQPTCTTPIYLISAPVFPLTYSANVHLFQTTYEVKISGGGWYQ